MQHIVIIPLYGAQKKTVFENIDELNDESYCRKLSLVEVGQINRPNMEKISVLWKDFISIIFDVKDDTIDYELLRLKNNDWVTKYKYFHLNITPYIHIFCSHQPNQIKKK